MANETTADVFSGEMLRFQVPKPMRGCEMLVCGSAIGRCASRDEAWGIEDARMASRN